MDSRTFNTSRILRTVHTRWRWWLGALVLTIVGVNVAGLFLPKRYESMGQIKIHNSQVSDMAGPFSHVLTIQDQLSTIRAEITGFTFLSKVAHDLGLGAQYPENSRDYAKLIDHMRKYITLSVVGADYFTVAYRSESPQEAQSVCSKIIENYLISTSAYVEKNYRSVDRVLSEEMRTANDEASRTQSAVLAYKNSHLNEIPEMQEANIKRLDDYRFQKAAAEQQAASLGRTIGDLQIRLKTTAKMVDSEKTTQGNLDVQQLRKEKQDLIAQLASLRENFTEEHWQVKKTREQLTNTSATLAKLESTPVETIKQTTNPEFERLQATIDTDNAELQRLQSQWTAFDPEIRRLQTYLDRVPESRLELQRLDALHTAAEEHVARVQEQLQKAKLTGEIEQNGQGPSFELFDPPRVPQLPASPNPVKIGLASVPLGALAAAAAIYLFTMLDSVVRDVAEARLILQMPILGIVQNIVTVAEARRRRTRRLRRVLGWSAGLTVLVVAIVMGLTYFHQPLAQHMESLTQLLARW